MIGPKRARLLLRFGLCVSVRRAGCAGRQNAQWRASRPPSRPRRGARCNRGAARWDRCRGGPKRGPRWRNRHAASPEPPDHPQEAGPAERLNRSGCVGHNERAARLQQERPPLTTSTSLLVFDPALACDRSPFARSDITAGNITSFTRIRRWLRWRRPH